VVKEKKGIAKRKARMLIKEVRTRKRQLNSGIKLKIKTIKKEEKKKDEGGMSFIGRRGDWIARVMSMIQEQSIAKLDELTEDAKSSFGEIVKMVSPLRSLAGILKSKSFAVEAAAAGRTLLYAAGAMGADDRMMDSSVEIKETLMEHFKEINANGRVLLRRNWTLVNKLRGSFEEKNLDKLQADIEKVDVERVQPELEEKRMSA